MAAISCGRLSAGASIRACSLARLTLALLTSGSLRNARSTRPARLAQVMPWIGRSKVVMVRLPVTSWLQDQPCPHGKVKHSVQCRRGMQSQAVATHGDAVATYFAGLQFQRLPAQLGDAVPARAG